MMLSTEHRNILTHKELVLKIKNLRAEKLLQEEGLKVAFKELSSSFNPISVIKESLQGLANDKEVRLDLVKVSANLALTLIINHVFKNTIGLKDSIGWKLLKLIPTSIISDNIIKLRDRFSSRSNGIRSGEKVI